MHQVFERIRFQLHLRPQSSRGEGIVELAPHRVLARQQGERVPCDLGKLQQASPALRFQSDSHHGFVETLQYLQIGMRFGVKTDGEIEIPTQYALY